MARRRNRAKGAASLVMRRSERKRTEQLNLQRALWVFRCRRAEEKRVVVVVVVVAARTKSGAFDRSPSGAG